MHMLQFDLLLTTNELFNLQWRVNKWTLKKPQQQQQQFIYLFIYRK